MVQVMLHRPRFAGKAIQRARRRRGPPGKHTTTTQRGNLMIRRYPAERDGLDVRRLNHLALNESKLLDTRNRRADSPPSASAGTALFSLTLTVMPGFTWNPACCISAVHKNVAVRDIWRACCTVGESEAVHRVRRIQKHHQVAACDAAHALGLFEGAPHLFLGAARNGPDPLLVQQLLSVYRGLAPQGRTCPGAYGRLVKAFLDRPTQDPNRRQLVFWSRTARLSFSVCPSLPAFP